MLQKLVLVEVTVKKAAETDERLFFWKMLLLNLVTCGIYGLISHFKLLRRRDAHFSRVVTLYKDIEECIKEVAEKKGKSSSINQELMQLERLRDDEIFKPRNAVMWFVLSLVPILGIYPLYYLTVDYPDHETKEEEAAKLISDMLNKLGISNFAINHEKVLQPKNVVLYLVWTLISCGFFGIYWMYLNYEEPNRHFDADNRWEVQVLTALRSV